MDLLKEHPEVTAVDEAMYELVVTKNAALKDCSPELLALACALSLRRSLQRRTKLRHLRLPHLVGYRHG